MGAAMEGFAIDVPHRAVSTTLATLHAHREAGGAVLPSALGTVDGSSIDKHVADSVRPDISATTHDVTLAATALFPVPTLAPDGPPLPKGQFPADAALGSVHSLAIEGANRRAGIMQTICEHGFADIPNNDVLVPRASMRSEISIVPARNSLGFADDRLSVLPTVNATHAEVFVHQLADALAGDPILRANPLKRVSLTVEGDHDLSALFGALDGRANAALLTRQLHSETAAVERNITRGQPEQRSHSLLGHAQTAEFDQNRALSHLFFRDARHDARTALRGSEPKTSGRRS